MKKTIIDYFEETAKSYPQNIAIGDENNELTFDEVRNTARNIASQVAKKGVIKKPIALFMKRATSLPVAMLSVLYSGNFYVVLDYESPKTRIDKILNTLKPQMIIYESEYKDIVDTFEGDYIMLDYDNSTLTNQTDDELLNAVHAKTTSSDPAYALFTSGSTGVPKGAILTNLNVISYIHWFITCFNIDSQTVFGSQTSLYFSMSVSDFYASMFTGASYMMIPKSYFAFPAKLIMFMNEKSINTVYWVPSALGIVAKFDLFKYCMPNSLNKILFAGEVMPVKYLNYWKKYLPNALYANLFGPTETTDICSYYIVNREFEETQSIPIGVPCDNCSLFLVDDEGKEVTDNGVGELYVLSPFVACGYYDNEQKTNEVFVQNPLNKCYPEKVYKTGDLVHYNEYGELEYVGRKDFQIKHLGYRIEPSEIESVLNTVDGVDLTVCIYDENEDVLILAYEAQNDLTQELKDACARLLPHYMQPTLFNKFSVFPKNANGKIDRKQIKNIILEK